MKTKVSLYLRSRVSTVTYDAIIALVSEYDNGFYVDSIDPVLWTTGRRLLIDFIRLHDDIDDSGPGGEVTTTADYERFTQAVYRLVSPGPDLQFDPYDIQLLLIEEDESAT